MTNEKKGYLERGGNIRRKIDRERERIINLRVE